MLSRNTIIGLRSNISLNLIRDLSISQKCQNSSSSATASGSSSIDQSNINNMKSKKSWSEASNASSSNSKSSSVQSDISENLSRITESMSSGEPPIHIAQTLQRKFKSGTTYNPFDFSMNRYRMEKKQNQQVKKEDPFVKSGINPRTLYLMPEILSQFLTSTGQILPRSITGCNAKNQKRLTAAIKNARNLGLLSTVHKHYRFLPSRNI
ncbi:uncharacterized protein KGF55_000874 [Candida pseudojiufengensis]|uniref:uncharacterized protein n=1 Tax=Candida pseudojiufengensis TaxID=497109 RepID=UPI002225474A|nr:uncharacterized protein KGF55_000874 [Candida pseudojiufengensis]KAI5966565.1 hypothetical protein KGF55_000874 [Candida pseudojiufengensis]